jgi:hypothetical protein
MLQSTTLSIHSMLQSTWDQHWPAPHAAEPARLKVWFVAKPSTLVTLLLTPVENQAQDMLSNSFLPPVHICDCYRFFATVPSFPFFATPFVYTL